VYLHWPPLFGLLLSRAFLIWGETELVARALAFTIATASIAAFAFLASSVLDRLGAALGTLAYASVPAFILYSRLVQGNLLCISFTMVALGCFIRAVRHEPIDRRWAAAGLVAQAVTVASWWGDGALLGLPLLLTGVLGRRRPVVLLALGYLLVAAMTAACIMLAMLVAAPTAAAELWATIVFRATGVAGEGFTSGGLHALPSRLYYTFSPGWPAKLNAYWHQATLLIGWVGIGAFVAGAIVRMRERKTLRVSPGLLSAAGVGGVWLGWYLLMSNQAADNDFQMLLGVPLVGLASGFVGRALLRRAEERAPLVAPALLALLMALYLGQTAFLARKWSRPLPPSGLVEYAREIRATTPSDAIVFVPSPSMVPVYYSERHVIRGIADGASVALAVRMAKQEYPQSPIYLALQPRDVDSSSEQFRTVHFAHASPSLLLLRLR
jgi:4-amino-4-deoxy-L-arabinose transferase-like glycosyltransferase